jgi:hypothetical protein
MRARKFELDLIHVYTLLSKHFGKQHWWPAETCMHDKPPLQVDIAGPSGGWSYKLTAIRTSLPNFAYIVTVGKSKATRKCPFCGKQVRVQANFCNRCGRQIKNIVHAHDFRYAQDL